MWRILDNLEKNTSNSKMTRFYQLMVIFYKSLHLNPSFTVDKGH